jgi:Ca2+-binding EF-hand superfamily protein
VKTIGLELDQMKFPQYVAAFISIPRSVMDVEILPAFQVFDEEKRGFADLEEMMKCLTNVGEPLDEAEAKAFQSNANVNEQGLFDYNGQHHSNRMT